LSGGAGLVSDLSFKAAPRFGGAVSGGLGLNRQHDQTAPLARVGLVLMVLTI